MARNGSGVYSLPANTAAVTNDPISSTKYNSLTSDLETDANTARPVVAGGTGATTALAARDNLLISSKILDKSAAYTAVAADRGKVIRSTATMTLSLTAAATLADGWCIDVISYTGTLTIDPNGSETIDGAATLTIEAGNKARIFCNGTAFFTAGINTGPIDGRVIGGTTPAAGTFTTATATTITTGTGGIALSGPLAVTSAQIQNADEVTIASAAALPITTASNSFYVTGTTTITSMATVPAGTEFTLRFAGALTLTHNATSLILPGAANLTTAAGDIFRFRSNGSGNYRMIGGVKADGTAIAGGSSYRTLLEAVTVSTAVAAVDLTAFDHATYSRYQVDVYSYVPDTNNTQIILRLSSDGGSTFLASGYNTGYIGVDASGSAANVFSNTTTVHSAFTGTSQATGGTGRMSLELSDMGDAAARTTLDGKSSNTAGVGKVHIFSGGYGSAGAHNALRLLSSLGNISAGEFKLYGLV